LKSNYSTEIAGRNNAKSKSNKDKGTQTDPKDSWLEAFDGCNQQTGADLKNRITRQQRKELRSLGQNKSPLLPP